MITIINNNNNSPEMAVCGAYYEDLLNVPDLNVLSFCPACEEKLQRVRVAAHEKRVSAGKVM